MVVGGAKTIGELRVGRTARLVTVAIVLLCAGVLGSSTVSASASPQIGRCVAQKKGNFTDANCTTLGTKKGVPVEHKGSFEFIPGVPFTCVAQKHGEYKDENCALHSKLPAKGRFERVAAPLVEAQGSTVTLETPSFGVTVSCKGSLAKGSVTGAATIQLTRFLEGCTSTGTVGGPASCSGLEANVQGTLAALAGGHTGLRLEYGLGGAHQLQFTCGSEKLRVNGRLAGTLGGIVGTSSTLGTLGFANTTETQNLQSEFQPSGTTSWFGPFGTVEISAMTLQFEAPVEIKG